MSKKTLVIGASENETRYSNIAIRLLEEYDNHVIGVGRRKGKVNNTDIHEDLPVINDIHTITLYVSEKYQIEYEEYILNTIKPKRIIFNPGTENVSLFNKAKENGIEVLNSCTLVMIKTRQY